MRSRKFGDDENRDLIEELVGEEKDDHQTHQRDGSYVILNDIVVDRGPSPSKSVSEQSTKTLGSYKSFANRT